MTIKKLLSMSFNQTEILALFVFGFTFLIGAFDIGMALRYFTFLFLGSFLLLFYKYIQSLKEKKK